MVYQNTQQNCTKFLGMLGEDEKMMPEKNCDFFKERPVVTTHEKNNLITILLKKRFNQQLEKVYSQDLVKQTVVYC